MHFERGGNLIAQGDYRHGIRRLIDCCRLDPANLLYRQALRRADKARFNNCHPGGWLPWLLSWPLRARLRTARLAGRYLEVLHLAERILVGNPWDVPTQVELAEAAEALGLTDVAVWSLEQARHADRTARPEPPARPPLRAARPVPRTLACGAGPQDRSGRRGSVRSATGRPARRGFSAGTSVDEQATALRARLHDDPLQPEPYRDLARLYRQADRFEQAEAVLLEGLAATGNAFLLTVELADLHIEPYRRDLALTERKMTATPSDDELRRIHAGLRREINTRELELHRLLADRYPGQLGHRYEVGLRLLRAGQLDEAVNELKPVRTDVRLRGPALLALGHGYRSRANLRLALQHFDDAVACLPADDHERRKEALYEAAGCHAALSEWAPALARAAECLAVDPAYRDLPARVADWQLHALQAQAS
ncbi:MAG: hypothetical protein U0736_23200 [Gemmataceae bacterium]